MTDTGESNKTVTHPVGEDVLRSAFVEMLFALAVSQVAIYAADLVSIVTPMWNKAPAFAHLGVALILIAASWVGWRQSVSPGMKEKVKYIFSTPFIGLLVDVLLVVLYFIIVRNVEIEQKGGETSLAAATAVPESFWLCVVFMIYAFWDLVADVLSPGCIPRLGFWKHLWKFVRAAFVSVITSVICLLPSYLVYRVATRTTEADEVLFLDAMLICVILFFRVLKPAETWLAKFARVTDCKTFQTPREAHGGELWWSIVLLILYVLSFLGACSFDLCEASRKLFG